MSLASPDDRSPRRAGRHTPRRLVSSGAPAFAFGLATGLATALATTLATVLATATPALAQPKAVQFRHLGTESGLSQGSVHALLQDRQGFLWMATQDGLNRWDGKRFVISKHDPADPDSLSAPHLWSLAEDAAGRLWIGTDGGGLDRLDPPEPPSQSRGSVFAHHRHDPDVPTSLASDRVRAIAFDHRGTLWVGTDAGLQRHLGGDRFETVPTADPRVLTLSADTDGTMWVGTRGGAERFGTGGERLDAIEGVGSAPTARQVRAILRDHGGHLWLGTYGGLGRVDPADGTMTVFRHRPGDPFSLPDDRVRSLLEDHEGRIWVATDGGLAVFRPGESAFHVYRHDPSWAGSLVLDAVLALYQDRGDVLWVATQGRGVDRWHPASWSLGPYRARDEPGALAGDAIMTFAEDDRGDLWIGTLGDGLQRWNRAASRFETLRNDPDDPGSLADDRVMALLHENGVLWIGTFGSGLDRLDLETGVIEHFRHDPDDATSLSANGVTSLFADRSGTLWIGTFGGGLDRFDRARGTFVHHRAAPGDPHSLPSDRVSALAEDDDALWVGMSGGGLARMDRASGTFRSFRHERHDAGSLGADDVLALHVDDEGRLWVGTKGGGLDLLERFDPLTGTARFRTFSERNGLPSSTVYGIRPDDAGRLWLSTTNGLAVLDPRTGAADVLQRRHGLLSDELNFNAHFRSRRGELFFGGVQGFNAFFPAAVERNEHIPPVVLTALETRSEQALLHGDTTESDEVVLDHVAAASFSFEFAALDYAAPEAQRFAYQLDDFDAGWIEIEDRRRVTYTNMSPGRYVFRVKASNGDGVWNEIGVAVPLRVRPAPWQTWWALVGYALVLAGIGYFGARWRHRGLARRSQELEMIVSERTAELEATVERLVTSESEARDARRRALRALAEALEERRRAQEADRAKSTFLSSMSHELRTPLNAMLGFSQLLESDPELSETQRESLTVIQHSGEHLLGLIEDILSLSKIEAGKLTLDEHVFDPRHMLAAVEEMVRTRAAEKKLALRFDIDPELPAAVRGDEGRLAQVLLNLVGNAVKFTHRGSVSVLALWRDGHAAFEVTDTGPGIAAEELDLLFRPFEQTRSGREAAEGTGLGLSISRELVHLMGGNMDVESREGEGATFRFTLPLEAAEAVDKTPRTWRSLAPGQGEVRVLIADDSHANRTLLMRQMEAVGAIPLMATNGAEAVEVWRAERPQLVWMDLRMPRMSGEEATQRIRELEAAELEATERAATAADASGLQKGLGIGHRTGHSHRRPIETETEQPPRTVIIALTATAFADDAVRLHDAGIDDVVLKPCRTDELIETMARWLDLRLQGLPTRADLETSATSGTSATSSTPTTRATRATRKTSTVSATADAEILIVDDDPVMRALATKALERLGHVVHTAIDGEQALTTVEVSEPALILMDVKMAGIGGLEATRRLRAEGRQTPIIGLTGLASEEDRATCLAAGMNTVLNKPFRLEDLEAVVTEWIDRQGSAEQGSAEQGSAEQGSAEQGSAEQGSAGQGSAGQASAEQASTGQASAEQAATTQASERAPKATNDTLAAAPSRDGEETPPVKLDRDWLRLLERVDSDASDPVLAHVVDLFLETAPHRVDELRNAQAAGDTDRLLRLARRLRNSSAMLGAEGVVDACTELENLAQRGAGGRRIERRIAALRAELDRAAIALASERSDDQRSSVAS